jgi:hypothetical protein
VEHRWTSIAADHLPSLPANLATVLPVVISLRVHRFLLGPDTQVLRVGDLHQLRFRQFSHDRLLLHDSLLLLLLHFAVHVIAYHSFQDVNDQLRIAKLHSLISDQVEAAVPQVVLDVAKQFQRQFLDFHLRWVHMLEDLELATFGCYRI